MAVPKITSNNHRDQNQPIYNAIAYLKAIEPIPEGSEPDPTEVVIPDDQRPICRPFDENMAVFYVIDVGNAYRFVDRQDMTTAGIDGDRLHDIGMTNLADKVRPVIEVTDRGGVYTVTCGGDFEATLLLHMKFWNIGLADYVKDGMIAAIPARDILAFCPPSYPQGIASLETLVEHIFDGGDHLLTKALYEYTPDGWHVWRR